MHTRYNRQKAKALSEKGRKMARARWDRENARRNAEMPDRIRELAELEIENLPHREGDPTGCLQYHDFRTGKIYRWTIRIGDRIDRRTMHAPDGRATKSHGLTWIFRALASKLQGIA